MKRFDMFKEIFRKRRFFKLVCGAGNEDFEEVRKLALVYCLAGTSGIDISANLDVLNALKEGIEEARLLAPKLGKNIDFHPLIIVSVGIAGDPHIRNAVINNNECVNCGVCIDYCLQTAISNTGSSFMVDVKRCIGCGACADNCPVQAINFYDEIKDYKLVLPQLIKNGAESLELHAITPDDDKVRYDWRLLNDLIKDNYLSMCVDRSMLSNIHLIERVREAFQTTGERFIIQADGNPMSGGSDDYNTTLQTIATADLVNKNRIPATILASGGTNSKTGQLAELCGVNIHGVSLGTFARRLVKPYIENEKFYSNIDVIHKAVYLAEGLIKANLNNS